MLSDVMKNYCVRKEFDCADYFETPPFKKTFQEIRHGIQSGKLIALTGIVGCGKTRMLNHIQETLKQEKKILVCQSLSVETQKGVHRVAV